MCTGSCRLLQIAARGPQPSVEEDNYDAVEAVPASGPAVAAAPHQTITLLPASQAVPAMAPAEAQVWEALCPRQKRSSRHERAKMPCCVLSGFLALKKAAALGHLYMTLANDCKGAPILACLITG